jgi:hypothetical protein
MRFFSCFKPKVFCSECKHFKLNTTTNWQCAFQCWLPRQFNIVCSEDDPITRASVSTRTYEYTDAYEKNKNNHCEDYQPKEG